MNRNMSNAVLGACLAAAWAAAPAGAADEGAISAEKQAKWLQQHPEMDSNKDGTLSQEEIQAFFQSRHRKQGQGPAAAGQPDKAGARAGFGGGQPLDRDALLQRHPELDADKDGTLSDEELRAGRDVLANARRAGLAGQLLKEHPEADTNGDGTVSREEFMAFRAASGGRLGAAQRPAPQFFDWLVENFAQADLDGNGQLSRDELMKLKAQHAGPAAAAGGPGGAPVAGPDAGARSQRILERFPDADTDGDGKLSATELQALKDRPRPPRQGRDRKPREGKAKPAATPDASEGASS